MEDVFAHVISTHPGFRAFEYAPKIAQAERNQTLGAFDWHLGAISNYSRRRQYDTNAFRCCSGVRETYSFQAITLDTASLASGISFSFEQIYDRSWSRYSSIDGGDNTYRRYDSYFSATATVPLWKNSFGYAERARIRALDAHVAGAALLSTDAAELYLADIGHRFIEWTLSARLVDATNAFVKLVNRLELDTGANRNGSTNRISSQIFRGKQSSTTLAQARQRELRTIRDDLSDLVGLPAIRDEQPILELGVRRPIDDVSPSLSEQVSGTRLMNQLNTEAQSLNFSRVAVKAQEDPNLTLRVHANVSGFDDEKATNSFDRDYQGNEVALNFSYPLGNTAARAALDKVDLQLLELRDRTESERAALVGELEGLRASLDEGDVLLTAAEKNLEFARNARIEDDKEFRAGTLDIALMLQSLRDEYEAEVEMLGYAASYQHAYLTYREKTDRLYPGPK